MTSLEQITSPRDLDSMSTEQLNELCQSIRGFLVDKVSATGGHLGPNLGVVELTVALHRVFESGHDALLFDTGHQSYVHKILTGRAAQFSTLRQTGGLSGYPSRTESPHDIIENSHASTSLSWADGIAKAWNLSDELANEQRPDGRHVVAVIGDGALTGGMSWEALNNIAGSDRQVIIVVNDNERSYAPTIGGVAHHLSTLRTTAGYERFLAWGKRVLHRTPVVGRPGYEALHGMKKGVKDVIAPQGMFEDLGLKYIGPVDGHDVQAMEFALRRARSFPGPVIVHAITEKGRGYRPAELDEADRFHGVGVIDPVTGRSVAPGARSWTSIFAERIVELGTDDERIVAITAAMLKPTGLDQFAQQFPQRTFDVGIAEQHAATSAAGMAFAGLHPVVAVYSTFINRAFDQVLFDCALHKAPVTFVLDRSGVTGPDGASHHGMWDLSLLGLVPGIRIAAPRDGQRLNELLGEAVEIDDGPTVVRFPSGSVPDAIGAVSQANGLDILDGTLPSDSDDDPRVLLVSIGAVAGLCLEVAERVRAHGLDVTVVDPRWVTPVSPALIDAARHARVVVTVEDNLRTGGVGSRVAQAMRDADLETPARQIGLPERFLEHGARSDVQVAAGMSPQEIARRIVEFCASKESPLQLEPSSLDDSQR